MPEEAIAIRPGLLRQRRAPEVNVLRKIVVFVKANCLRFSSGVCLREQRRLNAEAASRHATQHVCRIVFILLASVSFAEEDSRVVIGPQNNDLAEGASALLAGDAERGVQLTLDGLAVAVGRDERLTGLANLCAGYLLLGQRQKALDYCDRALAINPRHWRSLSNRALIYVQLKRYDEAAEDLDLGQQISPGAEQLKEVRGMLLDALQPVEPEVTINDSSEVDGDPQ